MVLPPEHARLRQNQVLRSLERVGVVVVLDLECVVTLLRISVHKEFTFDLILEPSPKFAEFRQPGCSHPDDKVFILGVDPLLGLVAGFKLLPHVVGPGEPSLQDFDLGAVADFVALVDQEGVVEVGLGDEPAGVGEFLLVKGSGAFLLFILLVDVVLLLVVEEV